MLRIPTSQSLNIITLRVLRHRRSELDAVPDLLVRRLRRDLLHCLLVAARATFFVRKPQAFARSSSRMYAILSRAATPGSECGVLAADVEMRRVGLDDDCPALRRILEKPEAVIGPEPADLDHGCGRRNMLKQGVEDGLLLRLVMASAALDVSVVHAP